MARPASAMPIAGFLHRYRNAVQDLRRHSNGLPVTLERVNPLREELDR
jgi:hypothetical protein